MLEVCGQKVVVRLVDIGYGKIFYRSSRYKNKKAKIIYQVVNNGSEILRSKKRA